MRAASTPTHILGLLLAAAAYSCSAHDFTAGAAHGASGVPVRRHERHEEVMRGVSHEDLMAQVQLAGTGLLHSLEYYAPKFIGWAFEYGMWFNSLEEGVHALEVRWCARWSSLWGYLSVDCSPGAGCFCFFSFLSCSAK